MEEKKQNIIWGALVIAVGLFIVFPVIKNKLNARPSEDFPAPPPATPKFGGGLVGESDRNNRQTTEDRKAVQGNGDLTEDEEGLSSQAEDDAAHAAVDRGFQREENRTHERSDISNGRIVNPIEEPAPRIGNREGDIRNRFKGTYYSPGMKATFVIGYGTIAVNNGSPREFSIKNGKIYHQDGNSEAWCSLSSNDNVLTFENFEAGELKYRFVFYRQ